MQRLNLQGQTFGRLLVLAPAGTRYPGTGRSSARWACECSCGTVVMALTSALRSSRKASCGCLRVEKAGALGKANLRGTLEERFWRYVKPKAGCWEWQGPHNAAGYGVIGAGYARFVATRVALNLILHCPDPGPHLVVMHTCDNPPCCNPEHLIVGTQKANLADMRAKGRGSKVRASGANNGQSVLSRETALEVLRQAGTGLSQKTLAAQFSVSNGTIFNVLQGTHWSLK